MMVTSLICLACFFLGLPCVTQFGQYVLDLMDTYGASLSVMVIAVAEMVAIIWEDTSMVSVSSTLPFQPSDKGRAGMDCSIAKRMHQHDQPAICLTDPP